MIASRIAFIITSKLCSVFFTILLLLSTSVYASCEYEVFPGDFNSTAEITLVNTGTSSVSAWDISWTYVDSGLSVFNVNYDNANSINSVSNTSFILDSSSNPTITATAPNFNAFNIAEFTLDPGDVAVLQVATSGTINGGSGLIVAGSLTGALCDSTVVGQTLTIVKELINDDSGNAAIGDFGIATDATTSLSFDAGSISGNTTTYTSNTISVSAGTYSLIENDDANYTEGSWSCTGNTGAVVGTYNAGSVVIADGERVICTITNDDISPTISLPVEVSGATCSIEPATRFWLRAVEWSSNDSDPAAAAIIDASVVSGADPFITGSGVTTNIVDTAAIISGVDQTNFADAYQAGDYIDYTLRTTSTLSATSVISGFSENGGRDSQGSATEPYLMDILMSDDDFATAVRMVSGVEVDDDIPAGSTSPFSWITDGLSQVYLRSGQEYKFRLVFYVPNATTGDIMMDDYSISVDDCTDRGDAPYSINDENTGGHHLPESRDYYIGTTSPDAEFFVTSDDNASGDTTAGEEDGVIIPTFAIGQVVTIDVPVTGSGGLLNAWIDWDADEVFDADEKISTDQTTTGASGIISLSVTVPADAVIGTTYSRFRWSPNSVVNATDFVEEGELEDYEVTIIEQAIPELIATKVTSTVADFAGNIANYTIEVTNSGGDAVDVVITDTPENTGFTYASSSITLNGGATRTSVSDPSVGDAVMNWSNFAIPAGDSIEIALTLNVDSSVVPGVYDNSVTLTASNSGAIITNYDGTDDANTDEDVVIHQLSPLAGSLVINEVLYRATGNSSAANDEFIELYNAGTSAIDLNGLQLIDGNLVTGDLDGTSGSITGGVTSFNFACTGSQVCSGSTMLASGAYAVIWVGSQDLTNKNAVGASFQAWLGQGQKLANPADDVWLFDTNNEFIDYVAWGSSTAAAVDTDYPLGVWDDSVQNSLDGNPAGVSISLTANGIDGDESDCWEETTSADASSRCSGYLPTINTDTVSTRITSVGANNNGGTIIIEKQTLPDGSTQSFEFTGDITASLTDGNSSTPLSVAAGTYTVTETAVTDWSVTSIICDDADSTGDLSTATATFNVVAGETITCVFTNEETANLTLLKVVNNTVGTASVDDWTLEANTNGGTAELSGTSGVVMDVTAGEYVLSELNGPAAYTFVSLACDVGVLDTTTNTLTLSPGDDSICTFTNRDLVTDLSLTKTVDNINPQATDIVTFTLLVTNNGPDDATNVVIDDTILAGFTFVAGSMTGGDTQNQTPPNLVWNINSLPLGAAVTLTYELSVNP